LLDTGFHCEPCLEGQGVIVSNTEFRTAGQKGVGPESFVAVTAAQPRQCL